MIHPWFKDYGKDMPGLTKKFFTGALSGLAIYLIVAIVIFHEQIDSACTEVASLVLTDKALGNTICAVLLLIVSYNVYRYAKRGNF